MKYMGNIDKCVNDDIHCQMCLLSSLFHEKLTFI